MNSYILFSTGMVVVVGNKQYNIDKSHVNYTHVLNAIKAKDWDQVQSLVTAPLMVNALGKGKITMDGEKFMYNGKEVHNTLTERILDMLSQGFDIDPMIHLLENLLANPSKIAVDEFYLFFERCKTPITEDGCIIAYKYVNNDFMDSYTRTVINKPAALMTDDELMALPVTVPGSLVKTEIVDNLTVVSMPRDRVDSVRNNHCSVGLHFCSLEYLGILAGKIVLMVKVDPSDIVSIPSDYNNTKGRCWRYTVLSVLNTTSDTITEEAYTQPVIATQDVVTPSHEHLMYNTGYKDGRARVDKAMENEFYLKGYKDGRGKQRRQFPLIQE